MSEYSSNEELPSTDAGKYFCLKLLIGALYMHTVEKIQSLDVDRVAEGRPEEVDACSMILKRLQTCMQMVSLIM